MIDPGKFQERWPWIGGDLQTLRNSVMRDKADLRSFSSQRHFCAVDDGSGDQLQFILHTPSTTRNGEFREPLVLIIHGLTGCEDSFHVRNSARYFLERGYPVARINLRGAGPSIRTCRNTYHAGSSDDLNLIVSAIQEVTDARPVAILGYSLGGNILLKFLGQNELNDQIVAACAVSAPIDLAAAAIQMTKPRNHLYQRWLLSRLKADIKALAAERSERKLAYVKSIHAFDECYTAPRNGFESAEAYYHMCSGVRFLADIQVPTLILQAKNDPWIPFASFGSIDEARLNSVQLVFPSGGGHSGFHQRFQAAPLHDRLFQEFIGRQLPH